jgi:hypothetical protein
MTETEQVVSVSVEILESKRYRASSLPGEKLPNRGEGGNIAESEIYLFVLDTVVEDRRLSPCLL